MKIAIIGAGMAGVAAAHALAAAGHDVTVLERRASVAEETSFAPAGIAAPGLVAPWMAPASGLRARWRGEPDALRRRETGIAEGGQRDAADALSRDERTRAVHRLLCAGLQRIDELARQLAMDFESARGLLLTFAGDSAVAQARRAVDWLAEAGEAVEWADAARQREIEPGRPVPDDAPPAAHLRNARVGNTREWTQLLRTQAQGLGVAFLFQHEVVAIVPGRRPSVQLRPLATKGVPARESAFDAVVLCAALDSRRLLAPLALRLPWEPQRGWSVTVPLNLREDVPELGPRAALFDLREGVSISRLGARVRVAGGYESVPAKAPAASEAPSPRALQPLYEALDTSFPGAAVWQQAQAWQAVRPALADGLPVVGPSGLEGLWLDTGHAHQGWALSQVAAETLCAMMSDVPPEFDVSMLSPQRFA